MYIVLYTPTGLREQAVHLASYGVITTEDVADSRIVRVLCLLDYTWPPASVVYCGLYIYYGSDGAVTRIQLRRSIIINESARKTTSCRARECVYKKIAQSARGVTWFSHVIEQWAKRPIWGSTSTLRLIILRFTFRSTVVHVRLWGSSVLLIGNF